jgi:hypothetical protein
MRGADTDRELSRAAPAGARLLSPGRGWPSTSMTLVRANWPAVVLVAAGLVLRVLAQIAYRPAIFYIDTPRYFYNNPPGQDPLGYGGLLRAILAVGNLDVVVAVQHLLGVAMAVVIYVLLRKRGTGRWLAALAIAPVLLDAYQVQIEQTLMPDVWFEALIVAGLAILLWRPSVGWRRAALAGVVLGASATVAQVGEALVLPAVIYLLALGGGWPRAAGRAAVLCVAFAAPIAAYCAGSYLLTGAFQLSHTGVTSFYGRTAAAVDCATIRLPAAERGMCPTRAQQRQGPDWLEYSTASPICWYYNPPSRCRGTGRGRHEPIALTDSQITDFNHRVLTQQPLRLLSAYGHDLVKLFALTRSQSQGDTPIYRWQFQTSYPYFPPWTSTRVVDRAISQFGGGAPSVWTPGARFLRTYQLDGDYTPGPLLAIFTITGLAGSLVLVRRRIEPGSRQLGLACLLFFASGVFVLLVSDLFEFSWRYQLPGLVTLAPAGALGIAAISRSFPRAS